ncbi:MAG: hypothetical protein Q7O66_16890 [Dehalococcoidia bacterium]|nr:hypothetical protein [Dehalococcoidia bacterium]
MTEETKPNVTTERQVWIVWHGEVRQVIERDQTTQATYHLRTLYDSEGNRLRNFPNPTAVEAEVFESEEEAAQELQRLKQERIARLERDIDILEAKIDERWAELAKLRETSA